MKIASVSSGCLGFLLFCSWTGAAIYPPLTNDLSLQLPLIGQNELRILSSNLLELRLVTTKGLTAGVDQWNFVTALGQPMFPSPAKFLVLTNGTPVPIAGVGFRRRPLYAPLASYDLRIDNILYLQLAAPLADDQTVQVLNPDASLWPATTRFTASAAPRRFSPAIHVNQVGYAPSMPKKAMVGCFLGSLGEMPVASTNFQVADANTGNVVYTGKLTVRPDVGYTYSPLPYQSVYEADFSSFTNAGEYQLLVSGLGASYPFFIDDGVPAAFARAYALGLYEQRCGTDNVLPFTRFVHAPCHTAQASVPSPQAQFTNAWSIIASYGAATNSDNPPQTAPLLTNEAAQLYPFVRQGNRDVSGGHHDAGDYSKYTVNSASLIHTLVFAADSLPGAGALDNLGIPESGDGRSDLLQEAKWEADFLCKMQDADGGFYFLVYPRNREYESNVLPDHGDPQIVWPKNTAATAAAVAALAQCASSPKFKQQFPQAASNCLAGATLGWQFLSNAIARFGLAGSYQKLIHYGDDFTHTDELAWAACEMFLATGNPQYQQMLFQMLPDPTNPQTFRWGWWRLYASYGNAVRSYAFAVRSGRLSTGQIDSNYLAKCETELIAAAQDQLTWSSQCAYGTSFPAPTKRARNGGWYFSMDQAFDLAVASALDDYPPLNDPRPQFLDALLSNMNYEGGCNPVNVSFVVGLGWKRQRDIVNQYAQNDRRVLPPSGIPVGNITDGFDYLPPYQSELGALCFPTDGATVAPYPFYDRWGDSFNLHAEATVMNQARQLAAAAFLMARTPLATQAWQFASAQILLPTNPPAYGAITAAVQAVGFNWTQARVVWEAQDQEPAFGTNYVFTPTNSGAQWIEAEAQWPDGRRVFAATNFFSVAAPPQVSVAASSPVALFGTTNDGAFTLTRGGALSASLTVGIILGGTAVAGIDYTTSAGPAPTSLTFPAGAATFPLTITGLGLSAGTAPKTAALALAVGTDYSLAAPASATVNLLPSRAPIVSLAAVTGSQCTVTWASVPGLMYQVYYQDDLTATNWLALSGDILAIASVTSWTDASFGGVPQRFYLVRAAAPADPRILSLSPNPGIGLSVNWASLPGQAYHLLLKNDLRDTNWTDLSGPLTATSTVSAWPDYPPGSVPQRFYRIVSGGN